MSNFIQRQIWLIPLLLILAACTLTPQQTRLPARTENSGGCSDPLGGCTTA